MLSKRDLVPGERADELVAEWSDRLGGDGARRARRLLGGRRRDRAASASDPRGGAGGAEGKAAPAAPAAEPEFEAEHIVYRPEGDQGFDVERVEDGVFEVRGRGIELLVARHDLENPEALAYLEQRLGEIGVLAALRSAGFEPGDEVRIGELAFELLPGSAVGPHAKKDPMTVVAKLGSSIVADDDGALRAAVLDSVCAQVAELHGGGENVVLVTSGAIARGMRLMELDRRPSAIDEMQAASAVGQGSLFRAYEERLGAARGPRGAGAADLVRHRRRACTT